MAFDDSQNRPREECGVFGIFGHPDAAKLTYFGLYALQHRGQESAGIITSDGSRVCQHKAMGLVANVFSDEIMPGLAGHIALGHVRYSTTGASTLLNAQPLCVNHRGCIFAVAHNGNIVNARLLRDSLESKGSIFQCSSDTEIVVHLLARSGEKELEEAVCETFTELEGAFSMLLMTHDRLLGVRDPQGFRPLCLGTLNNGVYVMASETCALDLIGARYMRDIEPGEVLIIDKNGLKSLYPWGKERRHSLCIFEFVYFARPDSDIFGTNVYRVRKRMGQLLAKETEISGDFIMPFPDSGTYAALGVSRAADIPLEMGVIRNHYVGRTFIQPSQTMRDFGVRVKLNPIGSLLVGKRVIIVDDSIIRGTTSRSRVQSLRDAGAKEVHMLISCPPTRFPCYYGIDFSTRGELIAATKSVAEIRDFIGLDSLHYLSLDGLVEATGIEGGQFCLACFTGNYPVAPDKEFHKLVLDRKGLKASCSDIVGP